MRGPRSGLSAFHPPPPVDGRIAAARYATLEALPNLIAGEGSRADGPPGDFNCTPWSPLFRDLLATTGMRTAPAASTSRPPGHHAGSRSASRSITSLVGRAIAVTDHSIGDEVGSDHFPVVADLQF